MPHSHHSHSGQFCLHAKSALSDVLHRARRLGFTHFHLSEHVPRQSASQLYPEEHEANLDPSALQANFRAYLDEARRLQAEEARRQDGMQVLVGCETENIDSPETLNFLIEQVLHPGSKATERPPPAEIGKGTVDFLVGSVHHTHGIPIDFDEATFGRALDLASSSSLDDEPSTTASPSSPVPYEVAHESLMCSYLDMQLETLQRLRPEVIGHFDLFRLYRPEARVDSDRVWRRIERNVRFAISYGALFECNAAAFRKGWKTAYPGREILDLIRSLGGRLCLSDDSHGVQAVALNYHRLREYLVDAGVDGMWYLEKATLTDGKEEEQAGSPPAPTRFARGTIARRVGSEWSELPFWEALERRRKEEEEEEALGNVAA